MEYLATAPPEEVYQFDTGVIDSLTECGETLLTESDRTALAIGMGLSIVDGELTLTGSKKPNVLQELLIDPLRQSTDTITERGINFVFLEFARLSDHARRKRNAAPNRNQNYLWHVDTTGLAMTTVRSTKYALPRTNVKRPDEDSIVVVEDQLEQVGYSEFSPPIGALVLKQSNHAHKIPDVTDLAADSPDMVRIFMEVFKVGALKVT